MPFTDWPRTTYYGWWILAVIVLCTMTVFGIIQYSFGVFVGPVSVEYGLSRSEVNSGMIAYYTGGALWSPIVGRLFDRHSMRHIVTFGALLFGAALIGIGLAKPLWLIMVLIAVPTAAGGAMLGQLLIGVGLSRWFQRNRAKAIGIAFAAMSVGGMWLPPTTAALILQLGWRQTLIIEGTLAGLLIAVASYLVIRNSPAEMGVAIEAPMKNAGDGPTPDQVSRTWTSADLIRSGRFWQFTVAVTLLSGFDGMLLASFVPYATDRGFDIQRATFIFSCLSLASLLGKLFAGVLIERFDRRHLFVAVAVGNALMAIVMILDPSFAVLLAASCILGYAFGTMAPLYAVMVGDYFGLRSYGTVMGATAFFMLSAMIISIYLAGLCFDVTGTYDLVLMLFTGGIALAAILMLKLPRPHQFAEGTGPSPRAVAS